MASSIRARMYMVASAVLSGRVPLQFARLMYKDRLTEFELIYRQLKQLQETFDVMKETNAALIAAFVRNALQDIKDAFSININENFEAFYSILDENNRLKEYDWYATYPEYGVYFRGVKTPKTTRLQVYADIGKNDRYVQRLFNDSEVQNKYLTLMRVVEDKWQPVLNENKSYKTATADGSVMFAYGQAKVERAIDDIGKTIIEPYRTAQLTNTAQDKLRASAVVGILLNIW